MTTMDKMNDLNSEWLARGGFAAAVYDDAKDEEDKFLHTAQDVLNVAEGAVKCKKCSNKRLRFFDIQTRGSDEKSTVCYICLNPNCKHKWTE